MRANRSIVHAAVIFSALLAGLPSRAGATELTGFGPIKFGMTKDEALAAVEAYEAQVGLDSETRWKSIEDFEDALVYNYYLERFPLKFEVTQYFRQGRASSTSMKGRNYVRPCGIEVLRIVGMIKEKYKKTPLFRHGEAYEIPATRTDWYRFHTYVFGFEKGALIQIIEYIRDTPGRCEIQIKYYLPGVDPIPF